ncbi:DUF3108 domain-containing protein [Aureivirga sp. CE67]|uniref:DUF3108 domain-containing protein n=1 Tax=Aureivirga sp. CE67 TaxID=1788983 RepID=UPI0018CB84BE|nr:DUF3108 domain-containing protein [Aureivirga sp. CE67]
MKKIFLLLIFLYGININAQTPEAFKSGEWFKFRMHYSNLVNAGFATLELKETSHNGKEAYHVVGKGWTTGLVKFFFKVKDEYQTYFYKDTLLPYHFVRRVDEGGHIISRDIYFDQQKGKAEIIDHKKNTEKTLEASDVQDMISAFYYLRNQDFTGMKDGDELHMKLFFDYETFDFKLRFLGREVIKTKFGKVKCIKFRPLVQAGRVFKEEESVTIWVSDDKNKIPLRIKASLAVGSLRSELEEFKGLAHPFNIIFDN